MPNDEVQRIHDLVSRWMAALAVGDLAGLAGMMTDDVVVIHGDGRVLSGKGAVIGELAGTLARFRVEQVSESEETIVAGEWAFDRARVRTRVTARDDGRVSNGASRTLTVLRREAGGAWLVARAIGVLEKP